MGGLEELWYGKNCYIIEDRVIQRQFVSLREARSFAPKDSIIVQPLYTYRSGTEMGAPPSVYFTVRFENLGKSMSAYEARDAGKNLSTLSGVPWFLVDIVTGEGRM